MDLEKGFVKNMTHVWSHTMKRAVGPGATIPLQELYEQYGVKHNLEPDEEFVRWLRDVKLRDRNKWQIFLDDKKPFEETKTSRTTEPPKEQVDTRSRGDNVAPMVEKEMDVMDIVNLTVRPAREVIPKINDIKLLKYAFREANQLAGKDSLCRIIRKRIQELEVSTRR
jgi:hypothetical protein